MARRALTVGPQINSASISPFLGPESASETFIDGAVLVSDSTDSNRLAEGGTNPIDIMGIAARAASGVTATMIPYYPALPGVVFEGSVDDSNDLGNGVALAANFGGQYGLTKDSGGIWYVDKFKTGDDARVRILGFRDPVATVQGRVYFVFNLG